MRRVIDILRENKIECVPNERFTLDVDMFPDNGEEHRFPKQALFEAPPLKGGKKRLAEADASLFRYFLDGSQRSHRLIDASFRGRYLPICGGQIAVAVLERCDDGRFRPLRDFTQFANILALPNVLEKENVAELESKINAETEQVLEVVVPQRTAHLGIAVRWPDTGRRVAGSRRITQTWR